MLETSHMKSPAARSLSLANTRWVESKKRSAHGASTSPTARMGRLTINNPTLDHRPGVSSRMRAFHHSLAVLLFAFACKPPDDAAVVSCENHPLSTNELMTCRLEAKRVSQSTSAPFSTESRNELVHVTGQLSLATGSAKVELHGTRGVVQTVTLTAGQPISFDADVPVVRASRSFRIAFTPLSPDAAGLSGTVEHFAR